ncbi:MAG TPA: hypothetical protein VL728_01400 [Cyclobacteriaceae bacterium]|nr:hypothetical protein [Cyclobacteriaceae bacterium]
MSEPIKVGFCVAYDWQLLSYALPCVYAEADTIWISIDNERKTWAGNKYQWDEFAFNQLISSIDKLNKIKIYEDNFHSPGCSAGENEVNQRNKLAEKMGHGGWHVQLDCDEYFLHFGDFVGYLKSIPIKSRPVNVCCALVTLFKQVDSGFLYVTPSQTEDLEYIQIATRTPNYQYGRRNGYFNMYTNFLIVHQSWARAEEEIRQKIANWGHNKDFHQNEFLKKWKSLDSSNYRDLINFHPIDKSVWPRLQIQKSTDITDLIRSFAHVEFPKYKLWQLYFKNSLLISRIIALFKKFYHKFR